MNTEILKNNKDVADVLSAIADKLGTTVEHFWPLFVKQQTVSGYISIVLWFVIIVISIIGIKLGNYYSKEYSGDSWETVISYAVGVVCLIICIFAIVCGGTDTITQIINPEYAALQNLIKMVR